MSNPQQPELARSRKTPAQDQDAVAAVIDGQGVPETDAPRGPIPPDNQPGHHPPEEQDKPDLTAFAQKLGTVEPSERTDAPEGRKLLPAASSRGAIAGLAVAATVLAVIVAVVTGRRRRSRLSR